MAISTYRDNIKSTLGFIPKMMMVLLRRHFETFYAGINLRWEQLAGFNSIPNRSVSGCSFGIAFLVNLNAMTMRRFPLFALKITIERIFACWCLLVRFLCFCATRLTPTSTTLFLMSVNAKFCNRFGLLATGASFFEHFHFFDYRAINQFNQGDIYGS